WLKLIHLKSINYNLKQTFCPIFGLKPYLSKPESTYFAKAKGISNYPTIHEGDILIIRADLSVDDGDLGVVSFNNSKYTTKRLDLKNKKLVPDNPDFPEIIVSEEDIVIVMGRVFAIVREDLTKKIF
ncbi:S24 family peptidase, partial [Chryseobacterium antibioticum]